MKAYAVAMAEVQEGSVLSASDAFMRRDGAVDAADAFMTRCVGDFYEIDPADPDARKAKLEERAFREESRFGGGRKLECSFSDPEGSFVVTASVQETEPRTRRKSRRLRSGCAGQVKGEASMAGRGSARSREPASSAEARMPDGAGRATPSQGGAETGYACVWSGCDGDCGVYRVFRSRCAALDYLTDAVFDRAETLGVDVLDSDGWDRAMTRGQVRDQLSSGMGMQLVIEFDAFGNPREWVSVQLDEVEMS